MKKTNPRLKRAFLDIVDKQLEANDPPQTRETFERLKAEGISQSDAKIYIAQAVCLEVWDILRNKREFNVKRYLRNLKNLPQEPEE
ncbi:hypothetical protein HX99_00560 [Peptococcaceae bacterium SCADC1_2_3]|jgi:hypothetical protein|nr:hypothetical protein DK28_0207935 [Peptococcaceae bacterium SCADC1_2_3]KFI34804.1 hypothetical protein HX99_00560 [Peptococcaceae bacterium SCADC1_2_3]KFI35713.1 hypothetical protein HY02_02190 [Peptococcaceae bacterium SCADC1_2_3]KFI36254.1 hypothetical protein HY00_04100 [Peptococcaceae bacterium SCADC1_2_3]HBQ28696.1 DUF1841 domain-containing protein [Desulfotomaculum sp.]